MRPAPTTRLLVLAGLAAALVAVPIATAGAPTPPKGVRNQLTDPAFVLSLPADGGAWTLWSGTVEDDRWLVLSRPRAQEIGGAACPATAKALTVCFSGTFGAQRSVVVGRVGPGIAVSAVDDSGRALRKARRGDAYLAVARGVPRKVTVVARNRDGDVVARRVLAYRPRG
ncbi:MAG: hypothetical protein AB7O78_07410 [Thermoleophilia bacterium]